MTSYRRNGLREATMRIHLLLCCFCVLTGGCAHVLEKDASPCAPIGVFPVRMGTNLVVAFVNQTDSPLYFSLHWKMACYGKEPHMEDGSLLVLPEFSEDMVSSLPLPGGRLTRLCPFEIALASAPTTTNDCQLYGVDLSWQVLAPVSGGAIDAFPSSRDEFSVNDWNRSFGHCLLTGDVFAPTPLEIRDIRYETIWKNGAFIKDNRNP